MPLPHYLGAHPGGEPLADSIANPTVKPKHSHNTPHCPGPSITRRWAFFCLPCEQDHKQCGTLCPWCRFKLRFDTEAVVWFAFKAKVQLPSVLIFNGISSIVNDGSLSLSTHSKGAWQFLTPLPTHMIHSRKICRFPPPYGMQCLSCQAQMISE